MFYCDANPNTLHVRTIVEHADNNEILAVPIVVYIHCRAGDWTRLRGHSLLILIPSLSSKGLSGPGLKGFGIASLKKSVQHLMKRPTICEKNGCASLIYSPAICRHLPLYEYDPESTWFSRRNLIEAYHVIVNTPNIIIIFIIYIIYKYIKWKKLIKTVWVPKIKAEVSDIKKFQITFLKIKRGVSSNRLKYNLIPNIP